MSKFEMKSWLSETQSRVERLLETRARANDARVPNRLAEAMRYSLLAGGKRLRPVLCLAFADAVAKQTGAGSILANEDAACALEFVHTYSLIHDDLPAMDDDDLRRGRPTNHKVFGEAMAILAGDALLTDAFALLAGSENSAELQLRARLCGELALAAGSRGMVGGQVFDIDENRQAQLQYLLTLHRMKTGALIKAASRMGALTAGADDELLAAAETYGDCVGLAFQIADDVLDVTVSAEAMGKPTGADAAAGRATFPAVVGLDESKRMADEYVSLACAAIEVLEPGDGPLHALARYSVERQS